MGLAGNIGKEQSALATRAEILRERNDFLSMRSCSRPGGGMHRWSDSLLHVIFSPQGLST